MSDSKTTKNAEDYIRYTTKQDVQQREIKVDDQGRICVDKHKSITVDHVALATGIIKLVNAIPGIHQISLKVISTRILNPGISTTGIGISMGMRDDEILNYEKDGLNRVKEFLGRTSLGEAVEKSNRDNLVDEAVKNLNLQGNNNSLLK